MEYVNSFAMQIVSRLVLFKSAATDGCVRSIEGGAVGEILVIFKSSRCLAFSGWASESNNLLA